GGDFPLATRGDCTLAIDTRAGTMPNEMPAHRPLQMSRSQMEKEIVDAMKQCIDAHGPITRHLSSANKRIRPVGSDE
ncbi:MAG: hypothetical protein ACRDZW_03725, partial [Acidimicrobiales bacterium]